MSKAQHEVSLEARQQVGPGGRVLCSGTACRNLRAKTHVAIMAVGEAGSTVYIHTVGCADHSGCGED